MTLESQSQNVKWLTTLVIVVVTLLWTDRDESTTKFGQKREKSLGKK